MPALSNSHIGLFTVIPTKITKIWSPRPFSVDTRRQVTQPSSTTELSLIQKVAVEITFDNEITKRGNEFTSEDDDRIGESEAWLEARRDWLALESSIQNVLDSFAERMFERAKKSKLDTGECLIPAKTIASRPRIEENYATNKQTARPVSPDVFSRVGTIRPDDSVSRVTTTRHAKKTQLPSRSLSFFDFVRT
jgi:hypothetical protein